MLKRNKRAGGGGGKCGTSQMGLGLNGASLGKTAGFRELFEKRADEAPCKTGGRGRGAVTDRATHSSLPRVYPTRRPAQLLAGHVPFFDRLPSSMLAPAEESSMSFVMSSSVSSSSPLWPRRFQ